MTDLTNDQPIILTPTERAVAMLRCCNGWFDYQRMLLHQRYPVLYGENTCEAPNG